MLRRGGKKENWAKGYTKTEGGSSNPRGRGWKKKKGGGVGGGGGP